MTSIYEEHEKVITVQTYVKTFCDWCGEDIPEEDRYETREFTLEFTEGSAYPEGGSRSGWEVKDLCDVHIGKLKAFLEENDVRIDAVEVDW